MDLSLLLSTPHPTSSHRALIIKPMWSHSSSGTCMDMAIHKVNLTYNISHLIIQSHHLVQANLSHAFLVATSPPINRIGPQAHINPPSLVAHKANNRSAHPTPRCPFSPSPPPAMVKETTRTTTCPPYNHLSPHATVPQRRG